MMKFEIPVTYYREEVDAFYYNVPDPTTETGRRDIIVYKNHLSPEENFEETRYSEEEILDMRYEPVEEEHLKAAK